MSKADLETKTVFIIFIIERCQRQRPFFDKLVNGWLLKFLAAVKPASVNQNPCSRERGYRQRQKFHWRQREAPAPCQPFMICVLPFPSRLGDAWSVQCRGRRGIPMPLKGNPKNLAVQRGNRMPAALAVGGFTIAN